MPTPADLAILREAKKALEAELDKLTLEFESRAEPIKKQLADFEAAERVWTSLIAKPFETNPRPKPLRAIRPATSKKPDHLPTVPDMIVRVLEHVQANTLEDGLTPEAILAEIRSRYWPEARSNDVGPIVWRMAVKEGRLQKIGALYSLLPQARKAAAE
ncbi:MAG: hypothetical protein QOF41_3154 [Methylobacteriaceae bacterium]|nr:hypothetical protein [Methylobacteriaceae bacterium]